MGGAGPVPKTTVCLSARVYTCLRQLGSRGGELHCARLAAAHVAAGCVLACFIGLAAAAIGDIIGVVGKRGSLRRYACGSAPRRACMEPSLRIIANNTLPRTLRQTDRQLFSGPVPHPPRRFYVAPPPYTHTRGCAPGGSPIGWAVLLLTSTSRARTRRAPRTARTLAVLDGLGAWGGGWVGRAALCVVGGVCVPWFRRSSASCALSSAVPPPLVCRFRLLFRVGVSRVACRPSRPLGCPKPPLRRPVRCRARAPVRVPVSVLR